MSRALGEIGGVGDVGTSPATCFELFRVSAVLPLPALPTTIRGGGRRYTASCVSSKNRLVEQMNSGALRVQIAHRLRASSMGSAVSISEILVSSMAAPRRKRDLS